jgi:hypothetical protein
MGRKFLSKARKLALLLALTGAASVGSWAAFSPSAHAVIGMPFTPMSYAGVARRTTRRAVYASSYAAGGAYAYGAYGAAPVAALPAGCGAMVGGLYPCGSMYYRPVYQGSTVVYVQTAPQ